MQTPQPSDGPRPTPRTPAPEPRPPRDDPDRLRIVEFPANTDDLPTIISARKPGSSAEYTPLPPDAEDVRGRRLGHFELVESIGVGDILTGQCQSNLAAANDRPRADGVKPRRRRIGLLGVRRGLLLPDHRRNKRTNDASPPEGGAGGVAPNCGFRIAKVRSECRTLRGIHGDVAQRSRRLRIQDLQLAVE